MAGLQHLPADTTAEAVTEALKRDGAVVVDQLVPASAMDGILDEMKPWFDATPFGPDDFSGRRTRRTGGLVARSPKAREIVMHPLALGASKLLLGHATTFQLHLTQMIAIGPGEPAQPIHRDQWAFDFYPFPKGFEVQCNTIWAMTDFTEENGGTRVVIGSTEYEDKLQLKQEQSVGTTMKKGSVLFYSGSVYHGGGANKSNDTRIGLNITYNVSWLRQEENQYLSVPLDVARTLPVNLLKLIGYRRGAYALGYVDDLRDPIEVVRPDLKTSGLGDLEDAQAKLRESAPV